MKSWSDLCRQPKKAVKKKLIQRLGKIVHIFFSHKEREEIKNEEDGLGKWCAWSAFLLIKCTRNELLHYLLAMVGRDEVEIKIGPTPVIGVAIGQKVDRSRWLLKSDRWWATPMHDPYSLPIVHIPIRFLSLWAHTFHWTFGSRSWGINSSRHGIRTPIGLVFNIIE